MMTGVIVLLNTVLKIVNVKFINDIGFDKHSQVIAYMVVGVFVSQFVNTGLMLTIASADLGFSPLRFFPINNLYSDFSRDWYLDVGKQVVMTMGINSFMPYVGFCAAWAGLYVKRRLDQKAGRATTKSTIQNYVMLYSGPDVLLQIQYSVLLNMVFVTFTYGLVLPILFPIALVGLINMYICERLQFAYFYKKPPMMGNELNDIGLSVLQLAPLMMMVFGYWQIGNRQQFFNAMPTITHKNEVYDPGHALIDYTEGWNFTAMFLIFLVIFACFNIYGKFLQSIGRCLGLFKEVKVDGELVVDDDWEWRLDIDEELGQYWECL